MSDFHVVAGASGNIGSKIAKLLLARGAKVRAVARHADKLASLKGAEAVSADMSDAESLAQALKGARSVFLLIPPSPGEKDFRAYQKKVGEAQIKALTSAGVRKVVLLSSIGGHLADKTGPIAGLHEQEERLNALKGVDVLNLRPGYFMENHLWSVGLIKGQGLNGSPLKGDLPMAMIATQDIAAAAAEAMLAGFTGKTVRELLGPKDYSMAEATRILGSAVGKPDLKYVQFGYPDAEKAMTGMGMSPDVARLFTEMYRGFNDGLLKPSAPRSPASATPTKLEDFAKVFAAAYKAG